MFSSSSSSVSTVRWRSCLICWTGWGTAERVRRTEVVAVVVVDVRATLAAAAEFLVECLVVEGGFTLEGGFLVTTTPSKVSLAFALPLIPTSLGASRTMFAAGRATSPRASRFRFPAAGSSLEEAAAAAVFARVATVDAVALAMPDGLTSVVDVEVEGGFARVVVRRGLLIAFSLSFTTVVRIVRVVRRT